MNLIGSKKTRANWELKVLKVGAGIRIGIEGPQSVSGSPHKSLEVCTSPKSKHELKGMCKVRVEGLRNGDESLHMSLEVCTSPKFT
jgi:hypothetical protein